MEVNPYEQKRNGARMGNYSACVYSNDTGEVFGIYEGIDPKAVRRLTYQPTEKQRKAQQNYAEKQSKYECFKAVHGMDEFFMYVFGENLNMSDLTAQTAARLMYLASWLTYDNNCLKVNNAVMSREQMKKLMKLRDRTFTNFLKEVTDAGYLIKDNDCYRLNDDIFKRGKVELHAPLDEKRFGRIYIKGIRDLYEMTPQEKHKHLGYIFKLIPFVSRKYNIICHNPLETDRNKIIPMTVGEFCDAIGYNRNQASRLIKIYDSITFKVDGKECCFCAYRYAPKKENMRFYVNPVVFFAGDDYELVEILEILFV